MEEKKMEIKALAESMNTLFNVQAENIRSRLMLLGMRMLVSEKKICLVRESSLITRMLNTMGLHSAPQEIAFSIELSDEEKGLEHSEVIAAQRKLMIITQVGKTINFYAEIIRDAKMGGEMSSPAQANVLVQEGIEMAKENGESMASRKVAPFIGILNDLAKDVK